MSIILSIVITSHNDNAECLETVKSIFTTTKKDDPFEIIVIDDFSNKPLEIPAALYKVVRTEHRIGVGPARHLGAMHASGIYLLFTDSHMRFEAGWLEVAINYLAGSRRTMFCGSCLQLDPNNMNVAANKGQYWGATWNFYGPDTNKPNVKQVFECIWARECEGDAYEIPAVMGACYFIPKAWYFELNPLRYLRSWGGDEQALSLRCHLAGGTIRLLKRVRIGHKFRKGPVPFDIRNWQTIYNKLFVMLTCLPPYRSKTLLVKFPRDAAFSVALKHLEADWHLVEIERRICERMFSPTAFEEYLRKFHLSFPAK